MNSQTGTPQHHCRRALGLLSLIGMLVAGVLAWPRTALLAEAAVVVPPPAVDEPASGTRSETAVLAGGCFWGVQGVFQHVRGVTRAVSGYSGGTRDTAEYETVSRGNTGHAESVEITYDPSQISYGRLLQIYFSVVHDPTELNHQGPDTGTQYRSVIFAANGTQRHVAQAYIEQLGKARVFKAPIVTKVDKLQAFYPAEDYHQNFLVRNPYYPYIAINDMPKVEYLKRLFPDLYQAKPVLVAVP